MLASPSGPCLRALPSHPAATTLAARRPPARCCLPHLVSKTNKQYYEAVDKHGEEKYAYEHKETYSAYGDEYKESYYGYGGPSKVQGLRDWHRRGGGGGEGRMLDSTAASVVASGALVVTKQLIASLKGTSPTFGFVAARCCKLLGCAPSKGRGPCGMCLSPCTTTLGMWHWLHPCITDLGLPCPFLPCSCVFPACVCVVSLLLSSPQVTVKLFEKYRSKVRPQVTNENTFQFT